MSSRAVRCARECTPPRPLWDALCAQSRPAELLARFIDTKLRTGNKGTSEEELEDVLDKTMTLFRFIDGKVCSKCLAQSDLSTARATGRRSAGGVFAM